MKRIKLRIIALSILGMVLLYSCSKDLSVRTDLENTIPAYFPEPVYKFTHNPKSDAKYALGRRLFYYPILSIDSTISCASCHDQAHAFADHNVAMSQGVDGAFGKRNSPAIFNVLWQKEFMADGGINHIEVMPLGPLTDPLEMKNGSMGEVVQRLSSNASYVIQFKEAFATDRLDDQLLFFALAQYMAEINSYQSKYDQVRQGLATFTAEEEKGYTLFKSNCSTCHQEPLFTDLSYRNNGIDSVIGEDKGRYRITLDEADMGKFKTPSLRNIDLTYPYMHDGRFRSLMDVLNHYSNPKQSKTIDPILTQPIDLSISEKEAIIRFLQTLNDFKLLSNNKLSQP